MLIATTAALATYRRDLGDGLILRWSTADDTENIAQLTGMVFRQSMEESPNSHIATRIRQLMRDDSPLMAPGDFGIVEDIHKEGNPIVACTCLWRQDWEYEGIPFHIGRPEIVASDPAYRNRGLIRALFEMVHARSESEGHLVQAITGIPYFYRQFGYEYALDLEGRRVTYLSLIPTIQKGETEPYTLREATREDIPLITEIYNRRRTSSIVWTTIPERYWLYEIEAGKEHSGREKSWNIQMIMDTTSAVMGLVITATRRWGRDLAVWDLGVASGINLQAVMPPVLRALQTYAEQLPTAQRGSKPNTVGPLSEISFFLGRTHPVYDVLGHTLASYQEPPYAWYVRVPNIPAFLRLIAPVLEKRLANSAVEGYTGELKLDFYRGGLCLAFDKGHLTTVEPWRIPAFDSHANAGIPSLVFLQLMFGHRSLDELRHAFPDVWVTNETETVLKALFPACPSFVIPL